ncbi:hypothetical protein [Maribacter sp. 2210JD10-5]|uniref:hypothetical protein n=1 Tax=Maribacter sp. 2210JD10-5 TaxID=3386272 RepID=UPI0039BCC65C
MKSKKGCIKGCLITLLSILGIFFLIIIVAIFIPESKNQIYKNAQDLYYEANFSNSMTAINDALKKDSLNSDYYLLKAKIAYELEDSLVYEQSILKSESIVENDSLKYLLAKNIIDWKLEKNDTVDANKRLIRTLQIFKKSDFQNYTASYLYLVDKMLLIGQKEKGLKYLDFFLDSIQDFKNDTLVYQDIHYKISDKFLKLKDTNRSINTLKKLTKEISSSSRAYKQLGYYYFNKSLNKQALSFFKQCIKYDTLDVKIYTTTAQCYLNLKKKSSAKKYLRIAAEKGDKEACLNLRELTAKTKYYAQSRCCDGSTSSSIGRGTCSHHGGVCGTEYIPYKEYTIRCN